MESSSKVFINLESPKSFHKLQKTLNYWSSTNQASKSHEEHQPKSLQIQRSLKELEKQKISNKLKVIGFKDILWHSMFKTTSQDYKKIELEDYSFVKD